MPPFEAQSARWQPGRGKLGHETATLADDTAPKDDQMIRWRAFS
jgi:hypothetical protein